VAVGAPTRFSLTVDGFEIASFTELVAITSEVDVLESAGPESAVTATVTATVTLRRGLTGAMELWAWHQTLRAGKLAAARRSATLTMYAGDQAFARYWLTNAAPIRLEVAPLEDGASAGLYETVVLACEEVQRVSPN
jgi:phage tail-like protein